MSKLFDLVWTTRDGTGIPVRDMTEEHAKNALRMMMRKHPNLSREPDELPDEDLLVDGCDHYGSLEC